MDSNFNPELDLDSILREFSDHPQPPSEQPQNDPPPEQPQEVTGDTIRLDQVRQAVAAATTDLSDTAVFEGIRITDEEETQEAPDTAPTTVLPEVEPFSEQWEPEYDEPMGELPPAPIPFRPKSRLKELREKLILGPEKRYYELTEQGLFKLQLSLVLCLLVFLVSAGSAALYIWGVIDPERLRLVVFIQFLGMLLSALLGCYRLMEGFADLPRLRFTVNTLLSFSFIVCCIDGVLCLSQLRLPVGAAFSLAMVMEIWSAYDRRSAEIGMMDTMRRATTLDSVVRVEDWYEGRPGFRTGKGQVEHFMDSYTATPQPEKLLNRYALITLAVSIGLGVLSGVRHGFEAGVQLCASALLMGMPVSALLTISRPMAILEKRLHKLGTVLCGWQGISAVDRMAAYPLEDTDLFPYGCAKLNGVKFYGDRNPDQVVAYATALIRANRGALVSLFGTLLESRNGYLCTPHAVTVYPGGIGGEIGEDSVLVGTLSFLRDMGVDMGSGTRVAQAVYCAIDGELAGVFAVTYRRSVSAASGLRTLCGYRGLTPVVLCEDFMISESFLGSKFGVNTRRMAFPGLQQRIDLSQTEVPEDAPVIALTTKDGLAPKAFAVTGARVLKSTWKLGVAIHMIGGIVGLVIMAALAWVGGAHLLNPLNLLAYQFIWMIPGILITEWTRTI